MDNLTHSLVGATLAELALPAEAPRPMRRTFFVAGVIAANVPDADLVYTRITPPPLGALLHHRGHTHTVAGLIVLGLAMAGVCLLPRIRAAIEPARGRLWMLLAVALASHLVLDSWNSYGVHPFWPITSRWFYGDAVYILEPWLWMLLGVAATLNTVSRPARALLGLGLVALVSLAAFLHVIPVVAFAALVAVAALLGIVLARRTPPMRSAAALVLALAFVAGLFALRDVARTTVLAAAPADARRRAIDVVLNPEPANPFCWSALTITHDATGATYAMTRGRAAVVASGGCGDAHAGGVTWQAPSVQSVADLRARWRDDCWVRAWLQFGRAPEIAEGTISDLRYGGVPRGNFTTMALDPPADGARCPANLTAWRPPRADLLGVDGRDAGTLSSTLAD